MFQWAKFSIILLTSNLFGTEIPMLSLNKALRSLLFKVRIEKVKKTS